MKPLVVLFASGLVAVLLLVTSACRSAASGDASEAMAAPADEVAALPEVRYYVIADT